MNLAQVLADGFRARMDNSFNDLEYAQDFRLYSAWHKGWLHADRLINHYM